MNWAVAAAALLLALAVDVWLGEPRARWHPVVWIGNYLGWIGQRIAPAQAARDPDFKAFVLGALAWSAGAATVCVAAWWLQHALLQLPALLAAVLLGLVLKPLLAWAMLQREVLAVEAALGESLDAGRQRLSWLVSRDVAALTEGQVRESAIESLAENLNDSVVAPIFWFVLFGLPGAALYRFANTADAMWGYRGVRNGRVWEWAGKWAAWADDVLSWLPARITAVLLLAVAGSGRGWALLREARLTPSPNSGWPMAAMALVLDVRLGKPGVYTLNSSGRVPVAADTQQAVRYARNTLLALILAALVALVLIAR
ncbi:adenosylcobinamide-phosphate synthase [Rhodoferax ferrireducens]|uniref:Cobalamin biosynthesis protein CobD n=1 Tax=Rhodoferax ferrireducens TaxID=192843 RepID=A0ABU2C5T5_9BURK|nr:adenosylcobinamide-phosphate synthase CbiB [Rhodoferax ferrireducens]MDR7376691.1 adenosylcobinamide-phosphate synthase [Rhodoferax ferrireducens]